ncbi:DUF4259 domain-containing protein [Herbaspirillum sp. RV1423]|uniref:DUF4259 domain-containing protein n=1 Tax=Herbaspirillum sp. RV1423 TaxID=1443993 RepID=UPI000557CED7|nr:DUF4259 domain-containing protein [Herbaspirillum sp. RV1423]
MGAWSHESFGNDDACDFGSDLQDADDLSMVEEALDAVVEIGNDYLEAPEASRAIAAAEVVARLQGNWGSRDAYSETVDAWVENKKLVPDPMLVQKADEAIERILAEPSELLELWLESDNSDVWMKSVLDLRSRLSPQ